VDKAFPWQCAAFLRSRMGGSFLLHYIPFPACLRAQGPPCTAPRSLSAHTRCCSRTPEGETAQLTDTFKSPTRGHFGPLPQSVTNTHPPNGFWLFFWILSFQQLTFPLILPCRFSLLGRQNGHSATMLSALCLQCRCSEARQSILYGGYLSAVAVIC
jgi:hypothetical protein